MGDNKGVAAPISSTHTSGTEVELPTARRSRQSTLSSKSPEEIVVVNDDDYGDEIDSNECEIISVSSDVDKDEKTWRNLESTPFNRLQTLISAGFDNPRLLLTRLFGMETSMLPTNDAHIWNILFSLLSEPPQRRRLKKYETIESAVKLLQERSRILVLSGAGISVSCGIPDFRSRDGIYARLSVDYPDLRNPHNMFDMDFFMRNPFPFFKFAKELFPGQFKPSFTHKFISLLEKKGKLLRNYTQNIDTLEQAAGITKMIQCHGSFATASCVTCKYRVPGEDIRESIMNQTVPRCPRCCPEQTQKSGSPGKIPLVDGIASTAPDVAAAVSASPNRRHPSIKPHGGGPIVGVMKPDIVFFGEGLPDVFHSSLQEDVHEADLVLVMGSSLKVRPVSHIPDSVSAKVPQILINRESLPNHIFDTELLGDCDGILRDVCNRLGWDADALETPTGSDRASTETLSGVDIRVPLAAAVGARFSNDASVQATASCSTTTTVDACVSSLNKTPSTTSEPVPPPTTPISGNGSLVIANPTAEASRSPTTIIAKKDAVEGAKSANAKPVEENAMNVADAEVFLGTSTNPLNVDDKEDTISGASDSDSDCDSSMFGGDDKMIFNLAEYLPDNSFTHFPPNQYIFMGAEVPFDYETAEAALQHPGNPFMEDMSSQSSGTASSSSTSPNNSPACDNSPPGGGRPAAASGDRFMQRLLRRCHKDRELQNYLSAKRGGVASGSAGGDVIEVIDCETSDEDKEPVEPSKKVTPVVTKAKRRKCSGDKSNRPSKASPKNLNDTIDESLRVVEKPDT